MWNCARIIKGTLSCYIIGLNNVVQLLMHFQVLNTSRIAMMSKLPLLMISTVGLLLYILIRDWRQRRLRGGLPLPPGPKGLPILGNILDIDASAPWLTFVNWSKKYGTSQSSGEGLDSLMRRRSSLFNCPRIRCYRYQL